jgi:hypothetical protein
MVEPGTMLRSGGLLWFVETTMQKNQKGASHFILSLTL